MIAKNAVLALLEKGLTLSTAESLTAGMVSSAICDVPGASGCFLGGVCAYQDEVKEKWLKVPEAVIQKHSAVSAPCARAMALGAKEKFASDFALSTTGYAGPAGENVGLVYVGIAHPRGVHVHRLQLSGSRQGIRKMTVQIALHILQKEIKNHG